MSIEYTLYSVLIVLIVIAGLLALMLLTRRRDQLVEVQVTGVDEAIVRLGRAVEHHVDVSAVVSLIRQIEQHPDALEQLRHYPETVRAAAWLHYINCLGADLQAAQSELSRMQQTYSPRVSYVTDAQEKVDAIRSKLDAAIMASGQKFGPHAV